MFANFNYLHVILILLCPVLCVVLYYIYRNFPEYVQTILLLSLTAVAAFFTIYDAVRIARVMGNWIYALQELPLYPCDIHIYVLFFAILSHGRHPALNKYVMYFVPSGALLTLFIPEIQNGTPFYAYPVIQTFTQHILCIVSAVLYLKFNHIRPSTKAPWKMWIISVSLCIIAHFINLPLIFTGAYYGANYFFTGHTPNAQFSLAVLAGKLGRLIGAENPFVRALPLIVCGYTLLTAVTYILHKMFEKLFNKPLHKSLSEF